MVSLTLGSLPAPQQVFDVQSKTPLRHTPETPSITEEAMLVRLPSPGRPSVRLSPREQQIVGMVAQGQPNKIIAAALSISPWTVNTHLRRIFTKLGVGTRAAMVVRLVASGLVRFQIQ